MQAFRIILDATSLAHPCALGLPARLPCAAWTDAIDLEMAKNHMLEDSLIDKLLLRRAIYRDTPPGRLSHALFQPSDPRYVAGRQALLRVTVDWSCLA